MAVNKSLPYANAYSSTKVLGATTKPVAIGPVPTPMPPSGVAYTPQYSGAQSFPTTNPTTYTKTPAGQTAVNKMYTSTGGATAPTSGGFSSEMFSKYYPGWSWNEAQADWNATGGAKANQVGGGGGGGAGYEPPIPTPVPKSATIKGNVVTGATNQDIVDTVNPTNDYSNYSSLMDPTEYYNTIDQNYNDKQALFNSNENALKAAQDAFNKTIEADYLANQGTLNTSKSKTSGQLDQNVVTAQQRKQDALNSAKQLYEQLQTGYRQRFGGASSAGEASQAILGTEQQRQSGQVGRDFQNTASSIEAQRVDLDNQYNDSMLKLNSQKQQALTDLQQNFVNQLSEINNNRAVSLDAKNTAKLSVLQNMRNQAITIQSQHEQYAQQLEALKMQQQLQLDTFNKTGGKAVSTAGQAVTDFNNSTKQTTSQSGQNNKNVTASTMSSQPTVQNSAGYIDPNNGFSKKNWWEQ